MKERDQVFSHSGRIVNLGRWLFQHRSFGALTLIPPAIVLREKSPEVWYWTAGLVVLAVGLGMRLWSVRHLGRSARTRGDKARQLLTVGPYSLCRNPIYLGNLIALTGLVIIMEATWYLPIFLALQFAFYSLIVRYEECLLKGRFGKVFDDYARRTPRWLPWPAGWKPALESVKWVEVITRERSLLFQMAAGLAIVCLREVLIHSHVVLF